MELGLPRAEAEARWEQICDLSRKVVREGMSLSKASAILDRGFSRTRKVQASAA